MYAKSKIAVPDLNGRVGLKKSSEICCLFSIFIIIVVRNVFFTRKHLKKHKNSLLIETCTIILVHLFLTYFW